MKKLAVILFLLTASLASAAPHDFIVLMDTSQYMFDEYDTVIQSYFPDVVKDHLKLHDIFHLISFSDHPELELTQKIENRQDMEAILRRLLLLQPLGKYDDPLLALRFVYQYASGLPSYQEKTIVVFTPGLYNAPTQDHASPEAAKKEIANVISEIRNRGWNLRFVIVPTSAPSAQNKGSTQAKGATITSPKTAFSLDLAQTAQAENVPAYVFQPQPGFSNETLGIPRLTFPSNLGKINKDFSLSFTAANPSDSAVILHLKAVSCNGISLLNHDLSINLAAHETKGVSVPLSFSQPPANGAQVGKFHLTFDDGLRAYPNEAAIHFEYMPGLEIWFLPFGIIFGIALLGALIFALFQLLKKGYERGKHLANQHVEDKSKKSAENEIPVPEETERGPATLVTSNTKSSTPLVKVKPSVIKLAESKKEESKPLEKAVAQPFVQTPSKTLVQPPKQTLVQPPAETKLVQQADPSLDQFRNAAEAREQARKEEQAALLSTLSSSSQKSENSYAAFLKQTSSKQQARTPEIQGENESTLKSTPIPSTQVTPAAPVNPSPASLVFEVKEGPSREFAMLVWTSDFLFQNTRQPANWFRFRPGERKSVGNSKAHFKIVLVPVSETIAEVSYDGQDLQFHPIAREYFPELPDPTSCLNTDIGVHIQGEKVLYLRFIAKTSKTEEVNKFLRGDAPALEDTLR